MKKLPIPSLILVATLTTTLTQHASAELIGAESFSYPFGDSIANTAGDTGFDWNNRTRAHTGITANWDAVTGDPNISFGSTLATSNGSSAKREYNGPISGVGSGASPTDEREGAFRGGGTVYYRVEMYRYPDAEWSVISSYDFSQEKIAFGVQSGTDQFGIRVMGGDGHDGQTLSGISAQHDRPYIMVAKIDFDADLLSLFLDPDLFATEAHNTPNRDPPLHGDQLEHGSTTGFSRDWQRRMGRPDGR